MVLVVWMWLPTLGLLAGHGEACGCGPEVGYIDLNNLAKGQPAKQSSIYPNEFVGSADKAVDGDCNGEWTHGSCTHTNNDEQPWWYVDLGDSYKIFKVVVKNREDCCGERLGQAEIRLGDSLKDHGKSNPLCGIIQNTSLGSFTTIYCNWQQGRYVSVHLPRTEHLTLCEVEVYGTQ